MKIRRVLPPLHRLGCRLPALATTALLLATVVPVPAGARSGFSLSVEPLYASLSGADLHILDEVLQWARATPSGLEYGAGMTARWFRPGLVFAPRLSASLDLSPRLALVAEGLFVSWGGSERRRFEAPAPGVDGTTYMNSVFLWDGDFRLPDRRQFTVPNDTHPSGWSPIEWSAEAEIGLVSGSLGVHAPVFKQGTFELAAQAGFGILRFDHHFDRNVKLTSQGWADWNPSRTGDEYGRNNISLDHTASSSGTAVGPSVGLRLSGGLGSASVVLSASQGWVTGRFTATSRFIDIDDILVDNMGDGVWDYRVVLHGDLPFELDVPATIPVTRVEGTVSYPVGPVQVGVGAFYVLYRNVPVSPDLSYRDLSFKSRVQDITLAGLGASVQASF